MVGTVIVYARTVTVRTRISSVIVMTRGKSQMVPPVRHNHVNIRIAVQPRDSVLSDVMENNISYENQSVITRFVVQARTH